MRAGIGVSRERVLREFCDEDSEAKANGNAARQESYQSQGRLAQRLGILAFVAGVAARSARPGARFWRRFECDSVRFWRERWTLDVFYWPASALIAGVIAGG